MKKFLAIAVVSLFTISSFNSCDTYHSLGNAKNIAQLSANPFLQNVARSVIKNMGKNLLENGIKSGKLGLNSNLKEVLSTAQAISGFKSMLGNQYGLSTNIIEKNFSKLNSVRDVVGLVAQMGTKGLNFYSF
jgi:hypothetical protein